MPLTEALLQQSNLYPTREAAKHRVAQYVSEQISLQAKQHRDSGKGIGHETVEEDPCTMRGGIGNAAPRYAQDYNREPENWSSKPALRDFRPPSRHAHVEKSRTARASPDSSIIPFGATQRRPSPSPERGSPLQEIDSGHDPYARRARHKMKEHDGKENKRAKTPPAAEKKKRKATAPKEPGSRPGKRLTLEKLSRDNESRPVVKSSRLTLNPEHRIGLFKRGRASTVIQTSHALPDLSFSEMKFLRGKEKTSMGFGNNRNTARKKGEEDPLPLGNRDSKEPSHQLGRFPVEPQNWTHTPSIHDGASRAYNRRHAADSGFREASLDEEGAGRIINENLDLPGSKNIQNPRLSPDCDSSSSRQQQLDEDLISDGHSVYSMAMRARSYARRMKDIRQSEQRHVSHVSDSLDEGTGPEKTEVFDQREFDKKSHDGREHQKNYVDTAVQYSDAANEKNASKDTNQQPDDRNSPEIPASGQRPRPTTRGSFKSINVVDIGELIDACAADEKASGKRKSRRIRSNVIDSDELQVEQMLQELTGSGSRAAHPGDFHIAPHRSVVEDDYQWPSAEHLQEPRGFNQEEHDLPYANHQPNNYQEYHQADYNSGYGHANPDPSWNWVPRDLDAAYRHHGNTRLPWDWENSVNTVYEPPDSAYMQYDEAMRQEFAERDARSYYPFYRNGEDVQ